jgi:hypothetical protein
MAKIKITDTELLIDIWNTEKELEAYRMIKDGYDILSKLPENKESNIYLINYLRFAETEDECRAFLEKLYKIKEDRKLE